MKVIIPAAGIGKRLQPHTLTTPKPLLKVGGKKETMLKTNRHMLDKQSDSPQFSGSKIIPPVYISEKVKVENSTIGPYVAVDRETEIKNSVIKNSIIGENTQIIDSEFEDSIIGDKAIVKNTKNKILNIGHSAEVIDNIEK